MTSGSLGKIRRMGKKELQSLRQALHPYLRLSAIDLTGYNRFKLIVESGLNPAKELWEQDRSKNPFLLEWSRNPI